MGEDEASSPKERGIKAHADHPSPGGFAPSSPTRGEAKKELKWGVLTQRLEKIHVMTKT